MKVVKQSLIDWVVTVDEKHFATIQKQRNGLYQIQIEKDDPYLTVSFKEAKDYVKRCSEIE